MKVYDKAEIEKIITNWMKVCSEESSEFGGYVMIDFLYDEVRHYIFKMIAYDTKHKSEVYFNNENTVARYYLCDIKNQEVIHTKLFTKEETNPICEKVINSMIKRNIIKISKSGKAFKYIG